MGRQRRLAVRIRESSRGREVGCCKFHWRLGPPASWALGRRKRCECTIGEGKGEKRKEDVGGGNGGRRRLAVCCREFHRRLGHTVQCALGLTTLLNTVHPTRLGSHNTRHKLHRTLSIVTCMTNRFPSCPASVALVLFPRLLVPACRMVTRYSLRN